MSCYLGRYWHVPRYLHEAFTYHRLQDLITYTVENPDPLVVKECVSGTGTVAVPPFSLAI